MAEPARRSSTNTTLYVGTLGASIGLFPTQAKPGDEQRFDTAGPNGGVLRYESRGRAKATDPDAPIAEVPVTADPLAEIERATEAASQSPVESAASMARSLTEDAAQASVEGEFTRVLVEEGSDVVVEPDEVRRGVRLEDGRFVDCTEQIAAIEERTKLDRIDVVACIDSSSVTRERVIGAYFVGATEPGDRPVLRLLYEALMFRGEVAVVKYTVRSRQQLGVIMPRGRTRTLMLLQLVWAEDFREPPAKALAIQEAGVTQAHVSKMCGLLELLHGKPSVFETLRDEAIALREELKARALAGEMDASVVEPLPVGAEGAGDLEAMLAESMAAVQAGQL